MILNLFTASLYFTATATSSFPSPSFILCQDSLCVHFHPLHIVVLSLEGFSFLLGSSSRSFFGLWTIRNTQLETLCLWQCVCIPAIIRHILLRFLRWMAALNTAADRNLSRHIQLLQQYCWWQSTPHQSVCESWMPHTKPSSFSFFLSPSPVVLSHL